MGNDTMKNHQNLIHKYHDRFKENSKDYAKGEEVQEIIASSLSHLKWKFDEKSLGISIRSLYDNALNTEQINYLLNFINNGEGINDKKDEDVKILQTILYDIANSISDTENDELDDILKSNSANPQWIDNMYGIATLTATTALVLKLLGKYNKLEPIKADIIHTEGDPLTIRLHPVTPILRPELKWERGAWFLSVEVNTHINSFGNKPPEIMSPSFENAQLWMGRRFFPTETVLKTWENYYNNFFKNYIRGFFEDTPIGNLGDVPITVNGEVSNLSDIDIQEGNNFIQYGDLGLSFEKVTDWKREHLNNIHLTSTTDQSLDFKGNTSTYKDGDTFGMRVDQVSCNLFWKKYDGEFIASWFTLEKWFMYSTGKEVGGWMENLHVEYGDWKVDITDFLVRAKDKGEGPLDFMRLLQETENVKDWNYADIFDGLLWRLRIGGSFGDFKLTNESLNLDIHSEWQNLFINKNKLSFDKNGNLLIQDTEGSGWLTFNWPLATSNIAIWEWNYTIWQYIEELIKPNGFEHLTQQEWAEVSVGFLNNFLELGGDFTWDVNSEKSQELIGEWHNTIMNMRNDFTVWGDEVIKTWVEDASLWEVVDQWAIIIGNVWQSTCDLVYELWKANNFQYDFSATIDFSKLANSLELQGDHSLSNKYYATWMIIGALGTDIGPITINEEIRNDWNALGKNQSQGSDKPATYTEDLEDDGWKPHPAKEILTPGEQEYSPSTTTIKNAPSQTKADFIIKQLWLGDNMKDFIYGVENRAAAKLLSDIRNMSLDDVGNIVRLHNQGYSQWLTLTDDLHVQAIFNLLNTFDKSGDLKRTSLFTKIDFAPGGWQTQMSFVPILGHNNPNSNLDKHFVGGIGYQQPLSVDFTLVHTLHKSEKLSVDWINQLGGGLIEVDPESISVGVIDYKNNEQLLLDTQSVLDIAHNFDINTYALENQIDAVKEQIPNSVPWGYLGTWWSATFQTNKFSASTTVMGSTIPLNIFLGKEEKLSTAAWYWLRIDFMANASVPLSTIFPKGNNQIIENIFIDASAGLYKAAGDHNSGFNVKISLFLKLPSKK